MRSPLWCSRQGYHHSRHPARGFRPRGASRRSPPAAHTVFEDVGAGEHTVSRDNEFPEGYAQRNKAFWGNARIQAIDRLHRPVGDPWNVIVTPPRREVDRCGEQPEPCCFYATQRHRSENEGRPIIPVPVVEVHRCREQATLLKSTRFRAAGEILVNSSGIHDSDP